MRKRTRYIIRIVGILVFLAVFGVVGTLLGRKLIHDVYQTKIEDLNQTLELNTNSACISKRDILAGECITADMIEYTSILMGDITAIFTPDDIGKYALIDISEGTVLNKCMVNEKIKPDDVRNVEYSCFHVSSNIREGDYIDVRIRYQDGEDMVVLSKKSVEKVSYNTSTCFLLVSEREQLMMSSAIYDTVNHDAVLYALKYEQPSVQGAAKVTYIPTYNIARLMYASAEIWKEDGRVLYNDVAVYNVNEREALEERLKEISSVNDVSNLSTAKDKDQSNDNGKGNDISSGYTDIEQ